MHHLCGKAQGILSFMHTQLCWLLPAILEKAEMGLCPHVHPCPVILQLLSISLQGRSRTWYKKMYNKLNNPVISAVIVFQFTELGESTSLRKLSLHGQAFRGS